MRFGDLKITEKLECPICLEISICVIQPQCTHHVCIDCFKRCHLNRNNPEGEPVFPYPEIEDEYFDSAENESKWEDYPLIEVYNNEWNAWDGAREEKYEREENLRKCPICRR
jgi:hypothetical protein